MWASHACLATTAAMVSRTVRLPDTPHDRAWDVLRHLGEDGVHIHPRMQVGDDKQACAAAIAGTLAAQAVT